MNQMKKHTDKQKDVAYYQSLVDAWILARIKKDDYVFILCMIGFCLVFISTFFVNVFFEKIIWIIATFNFLLSFILLWLAMGQNADLIEAQLSEKNTGEEIGKKIAIKTELAGYLVIIGMILVFILMACKF